MNYEKNTCQTAIGWLIVQIGWRIVQIGWRVVNLQKSILFTFALGMIFASTTKLF